MTMRSRPNRGDTGRRDQFVDQAAAVETTRLNCNIPTALHLEIKIMAAQQQTDITSLVIEALMDLKAKQET